MTDQGAEQFITLDSLGANPFSPNDGRHSKWEAFSTDSVGGISRLISSLREISNITDATSYEDWRRRYAELSPLVVYDPAWVEYMVNGDQTRWIIGRFTRVLGRAFEKFIRGPEDLDSALQIVQSLADAIVATLGTSTSVTRVAEWRQHWYPTKATLRRHRTNLQRADRIGPIAQTAVSSDPVSDMVNEPGWLPVARADWREDQAYARENPGLLRLVRAARLEAVALLYKEAAATVQNTLPQSTQQLEQILWPAFSQYAESVFDRMAQAKLPVVHSRAYARWLRSKGLTAVVDDVCGPIYGQLLITLRHVVETIGATQSPEIESTRRVLWGTLTEVIGGPFTENLANRLTAQLEGRSNYWEAKGMELLPITKESNEKGIDRRTLSLEKGTVDLLHGVDGKVKHAVTVDVARRFGGVGRRAIEKAIKKGALKAEGESQNRRILVESLLKYFPPENSTN